MESLCVLSFAVVLVGVALLGPRASFAATSQPAFDNLQVFLSPQNSTLSTFSMTVYNTTGGVVANSQSSYPAFSFELPSGNYLITATAGSPYYYYPIAYGAAGSGGGKMIPSGVMANEQEYGYSQVSLNSSSKSLTISTTPVSSIQTSQISLVVKFVNGTAASGASVYASVLGGESWGYYPGSQLVMSNSTGSDGSVSLTVPIAPLQVTAWSWVPVNLPESQTTTQVTIAGQPVNVTVYWQPTYVGLAGSAFMIPPFQQDTITLKAQQQNYWAYPQGVASAQTTLSVPGIAGSAGSQGTIANSPAAVPASVMRQQQGGSSQVPTESTPQILSTTVTLTTTQSASQAASGSSTLLVEGGILAAVIISIAAATIALRRK